MVVSGGTFEPYDNNREAVDSMTAAFGTRSWSLVLSTHPFWFYINDATKYINVEGSDLGSEDSYWTSTGINLLQWVKEGGKVFFNFNSKSLPLGAPFVIFDNIFVSPNWDSSGTILDPASPLVSGFADYPSLQSAAGNALFNANFVSEIGSSDIISTTMGTGVMLVNVAKGLVVAASLSPGSYSLVDGCCSAVDPPLTTLRKNIHLYVAGNYYFFFVSRPPAIPTVTQPALPPPASRLLSPLPASIAFGSLPLHSPLIYSF
jgi:hypothetical protein